MGASVYAFDLGASIDKAPEVIGVTYVEVDVTSPEQVTTAVGQVSSDLDPLRTVINCAGVGNASRILSKGAVGDLALFARIVQINLIGSYNVLAIAAAEIAKTEPDENGQRGVIINTASIAAYDGQVG